MEIEVEGEIGRNVEDDKKKMMDLRQSMDNTMHSNTAKRTGNIEDGGMLTAAAEFLLNENRSIPDVETDCQSINRSQRSQEITKFENQRAFPTRRSTIGGYRHASIVIEEGLESNRKKCEISNVRCVVSQVKKRWKNLWGKLKKL
ncbi:predicted protein [Sclerotinia sclerotiorum 1980 UF-70]|uniref:Uncharacterized protein n=2 Tax=Sclerotinia sclerotiorum (strain ATCC 18683 / 1980 / Ss-1) TaxID=665079 RepID=A7EPF6_SCLS1|nr:predicted protein [Sclerotinia sclerotiorum 1980 UF-70]APA10331.1 hypothetical protein sscle_06g051010 [Sclerotinia sclerotiorum 1980 UF-70]EDO04722.1 predicted protein [Sclerotinia sclerotiorum 1980 UF-70]